jgi:McrBC 5-methylcytosine restriction system component
MILKLVPQGIGAQALVVLEARDYEQDGALDERLREEDVASYRDTIMARADDEAKARDRWDILGLHCTGRKKLTFGTSRFTGLRWLDRQERIVIRVLPRLQNADPFRMYLRCLRHGEVARKIHHPRLDEKVIEIAWQEPPIPLEDEHADFSHLLVSTYLHMLADLCRRRIRPHFVTVQQNLTGRTKGHPIVSENIRLNQRAARLDRVFCRFQTMSVDIAANQILKTALEVGVAHLRRHRIRVPFLEGLIGECRFALQDVTLRRIESHEFGRFVYSGLWAMYREPHALARMILRLEGYSPYATPAARRGLPPHALNIELLFERYCEALLRDAELQVEAPAAKLAPHGNGQAPKTRRQHVRPDFIVRGERPHILDAKYKPGWQPSDQYKWGNEEDTYQLVAYASHTGLRNIPGMEGSVATGILFPVVAQSEGAPALDTDFLAKQPAGTVIGFTVPVKVLAIPLPRRRNRTKQTAPNPSAG